MRDLVLPFLNRYYEVRPDGFYDIQMDMFVRGVIIVEHLTCVFSIDETLSETLIRELVGDRLTTEQVDSFWQPEPLLSARYMTNIAVEPKKKNRFSVSIPAIPSIQSWWIQKMHRPVMHLKFFKLFGYIIYKKAVWEDIVIEMLDPIGPSTTQALMSMICKNQHNNITIELEMLDPTGVSVEKWQLIDCEIKKFDFGTLDTNSDAMATCTLTVKLNRVKLSY